MMLFAVLLMTQAVAGVQPATAAVPDMLLRVAYRQLQDGVPSRSVHHVTLACFTQQCALTTLTLNQCFGEEKVLGVVVDKGKMYPKVQTASTLDRDVRVYLERPGVVVAEWSVEGAVLRHQFLYKRGPASASVPQGWPKLTGFSGTVVKDSSILGKTVTWQMVPLKGRSPTIEIACPVMLDGVPE